MQTLFSDDNMEVSVAAHDSRDVILCFAGVGHAVGGVDIQGPEFLRSSRNATALFIIDKKRSWGNNLDFGELRRIVSALGTGKTIHSLGNSMGGFLAILATKFIPVTTAMAFVPQFTVHRGRMPEETRWSGYVKQIATWRHFDLSDAFNTTTRYYVIAGVGGADDKHLERFPARNNIQKVFFRQESFHHQTAAQLKEERVLYDVIDACMSHMGAAEIIERHLQAPKFGAFVPPS